MQIILFVGLTRGDLGCVVVVNINVRAMVTDTSRLLMIAMASSIIARSLVLNLDVVCRGLDHLARIAHVSRVG